ncbi:MAG: hypothetical protein JJT76_06865 [Clostridiaceae bacterium]|nr:hypothetical protein [Clostridiaceae bacterium]
MKRTIDNGTYKVKVDNLLLTGSDNGKPIVFISFKILNGQNKNSLIFTNQVITKGFQIHIANEFLRSLDSGFDITFDTYSQYGQLLMDVHEAIKDNKYLIDYQGSISKTKVQSML